MTIPSRKKEEKLQNYNMVNYSYMDSLFVFFDDFEFPFFEMRNKHRFTLKGVENSFRREIISELYHLEWFSEK